MFDFSTAHAGPVRVSIDGTAYDVPRFLLPQFKAWCAARQKASVDAALAQLGDDDEAKARFCLYWQPAPIDVVAMLEEALSPEGVEYVVGTCLKAAGVPVEKVAALPNAVNTAMLRTLAVSLLSAAQAKATQSAASDDPGSRGDPLPEPPPTSGGSATTTAETSPASISYVGV